jgi:hypothetical protein
MSRHSGVRQVPGLKLGPVTGHADQGFFVLFSVIPNTVKET